MPLSAILPVWHDAFSVHEVPLALDLLPTGSHSAITREVVPLVRDLLPAGLHPAIGIEVIGCPFDGFETLGIRAIAVAIPPALRAP